LKIYCKTKRAMVIAPGQDVRLLSFSTWVASDFGGLDWKVCPFPFTESDPGSANLTNSVPACGVAFGGSASSD
jgi:hypothetical protein